MTTTGSRITHWCHQCNDGIDVPNKGLGRAAAATWRTRHQGHPITENPAAPTRPARQQERA